MVETLKGKIEDIIGTIKNKKSIVIYGINGSGKTALAWKILSLIKDRKIYFVSYPHARLLEPFGYENLDTLSQIFDKEDSVIYIDEPQLILKKKDMYKITKLLNIARHKNILIIFSTSNTRFITPDLEEALDIWLIKNCDYSSSKQRSKLRKIIEDYTEIDAEGFCLNNNEFICRVPSGINNINGKYVFTLPQGWNESLSKPYKDVNIEDETLVSNETKSLKKNETDGSLNLKSAKTHKTVQNNCLISNETETSLTLQEYIKTTGKSKASYYRDKQKEQKVESQW